MPLAPLVVLLSLLLSVDHTHCQTARERQLLVDRVEQPQVLRAVQQQDLRYIQLRYGSTDTRTQTSTIQILAIGNGVRQDVARLGNHGQVVTLETQQLEILSVAVDVEYEVVDFLQSAICVGSVLRNEDAQIHTRICRDLAGLVEEVAWRCQRR